MISSFRDPSGKLFIVGNRVFRGINKAGEYDFNEALNSKVIKSLMDSGKVVRNLKEDQQEILIREITETAGIDKNEFLLLIEHEKIPFISYPYEWSPEMLYSAALLTLDISQKLLSEGLGLKDANPYNILFRGGSPVFVDWLSFEKRDQLDYLWIPQAQFIRTFLLPLLVNKYFGLSLNQIFLSKRDGLEPGEVYKMSGLIKKLYPVFFSTVTLPKLLGSRRKQDVSLYEQKKSDDPEKAEFILDRQFRRLCKSLKKVNPDKNRTSDWAEYVGPKQHFTDEYFKQKDEFVSESLARFNPKTVLDIGCNTGHFSRIAAQNGASVIAIDQDPVVIGNVWRLAKNEDLDILPLVVDITRPTPGIGWLNNECVSFLDRIRGKIDAVLMLAVVHHIMVTERIPLPDILKLISEVTNDILILEFVPTDDPMFKQISRGRNYLFEYLTAEYFENECSKRFKIVRGEKLAHSNRQLYLLEK